MQKLAKPVSHIDETTGEEFTADQPDELPVKTRIGTPIGFMGGTVGGAYGGSLLGQRIAKSKMLSPAFRFLLTAGAGVAGGGLGMLGGTGLGSAVDEQRWVNTPRRLEAEAYARGLQRDRVKESHMQKTASQIADTVLIKIGFSVTDEGHEYDADMAELLKKYHLDAARRKQEAGILGYYDEERNNPADILKSIRYGLSNPFQGGHSTAAARRQAYIEKKHRAGENAYNPFGGKLTPLPEEGEGATSGLLSLYGKVGPEKS